MKKKRLLCPVESIACLILFAGVADRLVPPDQPRDLWRHWGRPRIVWYQGGHLTFWLHREVRALVGEALRSGGLTG